MYLINSFDNVAQHKLDSEFNEVAALIKEDGVIALNHFPLLTVFIIFGIIHFNFTSSSGSIVHHSEGTFDSCC